MSQKSFKKIASLILTNFAGLYCFRFIILFFFFLREQLFIREVLRVIANTDGLFVLVNKEKTQIYLQVIVMRSLTYISISGWLNILLQVFGGCCSNVFVLEDLLYNNKLEYSLGTLVTFSQFLITSILSIPISTKGFIRPTVPVSRWIFPVVLYFLTSLLNNLVWQFDITVPMHIIFRSSGTVVTMLVGYFFGNKRYSKHQIVSSIFMTLGTIMATLPEGNSLLIEINIKFLTGILILTIASVISAFMGLYSELIYKQYGNQWHESLFYNHFLALPLFVFVSPTIYREFGVVLQSKQVTLGAFKFPRQLLSLTVNVLTQFICTKGVNMLAGETSALTVTVVLLVRKFVSLILSVIFYGSYMSTLGMIGSIIVFGSAAYYSISGISDRKIMELKKET